MKYVIPAVLTHSQPIEKTMDKLKSHPLEAEVDRVIKDLGGDLSTMKLIQDTGVSYNLCFDEIPCYIALPTYVPSRLDNLVRVECEIGSINTKEVGHILFAITLDFDMHRHYPIRVVPRTRDAHTYRILLQFVCSVNFMQVGFLAQTILISTELAVFYREEFLIRDKET